MIVVLDSGPLGMITNPKAGGEPAACREWLRKLEVAGAVVVLPEITDYEVRRELLRARKRDGLARLDQLKTLIEYLPLTTEAMLKAAELWAQARNDGHPTASNDALDADVILAAQAWSVADADLIVATTNTSHLSRFIPAAFWKDISSV